MKHVDVKREGGVFTVTLSNPPSHTLNAIGVQELLQVMEDLEGDASIRVVVLTGGGEGVFVAHYEVNELAETAEKQGTSRTEQPPAQVGSGATLHPMHRLCLRLENLPAVTIAAINGNAAGGGCELTLACDFRLMADGPFHYGLPETSVGIIPGAGGTQRFARMLGTARALDLILHATVMTPSEALELGLVHRVFPRGSFSDEVTRFARDLEARAPIAMAAAKRAIRAGAEVDLEQGLGIEQACFGTAIGSRDAAGAMRAFLSGKAYAWKGE